MLLTNTCLTNSEDARSEKSEKLQIHEEEHGQDIDDEEPTQLEVDEDVKEANDESGIKSESIEINVDGASSHKGSPTPSPKACKVMDTDVIDSKQVETTKSKPVDPVQQQESQQMVAPMVPVAVYDKYEAMQPRLKKFLKIYQQSSKNSLDGPSVAPNNHEIMENLNSKQSADSPSDESSDTVRSSSETIDDKDDIKTKNADSSEASSKLKKTSHRDSLLVHQLIFFFVNFCCRLLLQSNAPSASK